MLAEVSPGLYAGTTRAADRGEEGRVGLPGGKCDWNESPVKAAIREANEEGWTVEGIGQCFYKAEIEGFMVYWFEAKKAVQLSEYKEKGRIVPICLTLEQISKSGYGNDEAVKHYLCE